jgi:hypothetical protein
MDFTVGCSSLPSGLSFRTGAPENHGSHYIGSQESETGHNTNNHRGITIPRDGCLGNRAGYLSGTLLGLITYFKVQAPTLGLVRIIYYLFVVDRAPTGSS